MSFLTDETVEAPITKVGTRMRNAAEVPANTIDPADINLINDKLTDIRTDLRAGAVPFASTGSTTARTAAARAADVFNVKDYGATGDGATDDTAAINAAIAAANGAGGGDVVVPRGTYMVNPDYGNGGSVNLLDNVTLRLDARATLKAQTTATSAYAVVRAVSVSNVAVLGGTIQGERDTHVPAGGEWGMCVELRDVDRARIEGVTLTDGWGDGVYVGALAGVASTECTDVVVSNCTIDNARRNGISIVGAKGCAVTGCAILNINGTEPQSGIDIEPNPSSGNTCTDIRITSCHFEGCVNAGLVTADVEGASGITVSNCTFRDNATTATYGSIHITTDDTTVSGCVVDGGTGSSVVVWNASRVSVTGNVLRGSARGGIAATTSEDVVVTGNLVHGCADTGINLNSCTNALVTSNMVRTAGNYGLRVAASAGASRYINLSGNTVQAAAKHGIFVEGPDTVVQGNTVIGAATSGAASYDGINVAAGTGTGVVVRNNIIRPSSAGALCRFGIRIQSAVSAYLADNDATGTTSAAADGVSDGGTTTSVGVRRVGTGAIQQGFFGAAATSRPTVTGSRGGNLALADLMSKLATLGLVTDSTTS